MGFQDSIEKNFKELPKSRLVIVGVNPIVEDITSHQSYFFHLLNTQIELQIKIIYESESENFSQSLFYEKGVSENRINFDRLQTYHLRLIGGSRAGGKKAAGFIEDVLSKFKPEETDIARKRITLLQNNLRHFVNIILVDDILFYSFTTLEIPALDKYQKVTEESSLFSQLKKYIDFLLNGKSGGKFLSKPSDELIELYDNNSYPRGIYSTDYQRYSIWAFVFNRKGELLLHKRSDTTADNRALWDKSVGGHVDLRDISTVETAKRELIEEMFLPEAENT